MDELQLSKMSNSFLVRTFNFLLLPIRVIFKPEQVRNIGLTPIADERHKLVASHVKGKLLDIGCGENILVKNYCEGIGVDVYPWKGIDVLVDSTCLPFESNSFDTITFMANLNHIPKPIRTKVLLEAKRVLKDDGKILITMITPKISFIGHKYLFRWRSADLKERGMKEGESWGLSINQVKEILDSTKLKLIHHQTFLYGLNHLYLACKE